MTDKAPVNDAILFAGGEPDTAPVSGDRGDLIAPPATPAPAAPVVPPVVPPVETPAPAAPVEPEVAPSTPAAEATPPAEPTPVEGEEPAPRNRRDFKERLSVKNRKIAVLEAELASLRTATPAPSITAPTPAPAAPTAPVAPPPAVVDVAAEVAALRLKSMQLLMEGKVEDAAAVQNQADTLLLAKVANPDEIRKTITQQVEHHLANQTLDEVTSELVADYSFLDIDSPDYDDTATVMINAVARRNVSQGQSAAQALRMAANEVLPRIRPELFTPTGGPVVTLPPASAPAVVTPAVAPRKPDPAKNIQNASAQPAIPTPVGGAKPGNVIDIWQLDDKQFSELTQAQLAALRGDAL